MRRYTTHWLPLREAHRFVALHHRHHKPAQGGIVALGIYDDDALIGCGIIGRPVARMHNELTCEITRSCLLAGHEHAASSLLGRLRRVAQSLGFERMVTYTLAAESGASLRAAGWVQDEMILGKEWTTPSRPRLPGLHPMDRKIRWWRSTEAQRELSL